MKTLTTAFALGSLLVTIGASAMMPTVANADPAEHSYVACNQDGDCWRVHHRYAYGPDQPITYYNSDWYDAHQTDEHVHWRSDPENDRGYYERDGSWHEDPGARALAGGATGAGIGAAIGCLVTLPIGCAPGAAVALLSVAARARWSAPAQGLSLTPIGAAGSAIRDFALTEVRTVRASASLVRKAGGRSAGRLRARGYGGHGSALIPGRERVTVPAHGDDRTNLFRQNQTFSDPAYLPEALQRSTPHPRLSIQRGT